MGINKNDDVRTDQASRQKEGGGRGKEEGEKVYSCRSAEREGRKEKVELMYE